MPYLVFPTVTGAEIKVNLQKPQTFRYLLYIRIIGQAVTDRPFDYFAVKSKVKETQYSYNSSSGPQLQKLSVFSTTSNILQFQHIGIRPKVPNIHSNFYVVYTHSEEFTELLLSFYVKSILKILKLQNQLF